MLTELFIVGLELVFNWDFRINVLATQFTKILDSPSILHETNIRCVKCQAVIHNPLQGETLTLLTRQQDEGFFPSTIKPYWHSHASHRLFFSFPWCPRQRWILSIKPLKKRWMARGGIWKVWLIWISFNVIINFRITKWGIGLLKALEGDSRENSNRRCL